MTWFMGIDIGSESCKGVVFEQHRLAAWDLRASGINYAMAARKVQEALLAQAGIGAADIGRTITTGHGVDRMALGDQHIADVQCCAKAMAYLLPEVRTVIDVQAHGLQVIKIDAKGRVLDLAISEKCASGSGAFIQIIANVLQVALADVGPLSLQSAHPVTFTTGCAVFGESEAVSRVAEGVSKEDILAGVHQVLAEKIRAMADRIDFAPPCAISGGGGLNVGLIKSLELVDLPVLVPPQPCLVNAIGAALISFDRQGARLLN